MNWFKNIPTPWSRPADDTPSKDQQTITVLRKTILELKIERNTAEEQRDDYKLQVERHSETRTLHPDEEAEFIRLRAEHKAMLEQQNKLAMWLRENKKAEIQAGKHTGKEISEIIIGYLGQTMEIPKDKIQ